MRPFLRWELLCVASAALFCGLAAATSTGNMARFDDSIRTSVHALATPVLTALAENVTWLGALGVLALIGAVAVAGFSRVGMRDRARLLVATMAGAVAVENALKFTFQRARPLPFFGTDPATYSFPSGHALFSLSFYGTLAILVSRGGHPGIRAATGIAATLLVAAIGWSRIYLGMHYPSDVLGGYLVAAAWIAAVFAWAARRASVPAQNL